MSALADYTLSLLAQRNLSPEDYEWAVDQIEAIKMLFDNPSWLYSADYDHTNEQTGYLISLMDIERNDRLELMSMFVGFPLKTSNDARINRWMFSVLIDYYLNGEGTKLNEALGYTKRSVIRQAKRLARQAAKQAKAAQQPGLTI
jgi:hypothetical protein